MRSHLSFGGFGRISSNLASEGDLHHDGCTYLNLQGAHERGQDDAWQLVGLMEIRLGASWLALMKKVVQHV